MALQRILIRTHHMTSQKKIATITRAANRLDCSVVLKVGSPPGIMLCEGAERDAAEWESVVRKLRYKDMRLLQREIIPELHLPTLGIKQGDVREIDEIKDFARFLEEDPTLHKSWRIGMGYVKDDD